MRTKRPKTTILDLSIGNPAFLAPYWSGANGASFYLKPDAHLSYLRGNSPKLAGEIVRAHAVINNVDLSGKYTIVITNGATQAILAAMYAFRERGKKNMWSKSPYWFRFPQLAALISCKWGTEVNPGNVQVIARPNNPDNQVPILTKRMQGNTITDCCYNWPQYVANPGKIDQVVAIFSLAKMTGHAGSRIGWAIVRDEAIAKLMASFVEQNTGGISLEAQERAALVLSYEITNFQRGVSNVFSWGAKTLNDRWDSLMAICPPEIEIINRTERGMFAWCKLIKGGNAASYMNGRYDVAVLSGKLSGSTQDFFRVNVGCTDEEFHDFVHRLLTR